MKHSVVQDIVALVFDTSIQPQKVLENRDVLIDNIIQLNQNDQMM